MEENWPLIRYLRMGNSSMEASQGKRPLFATWAAVRGSRVPEWVAWAGSCLSRRSSRRRCSRWRVRRRIPSRVRRRRGRCSRIGSGGPRWGALALDWGLLMIRGRSDGLRCAVLLLGLGILTRGRGDAATSAGGRPVQRRRTSLLGIQDTTAAAAGALRGQGPTRLTRSETLYPSDRHPLLPAPWTRSASWWSLLVSEASCRAALCCCYCLTRCCCCWFCSSLCY